MNTLRSREDSDTETIEYAGHLTIADILTKTWARDALQGLEGVHTTRAVVLQSHLDAP